MRIKGIPETPAERVQRWTAYPTCFDYTYYPVTTASNLADLISRMPVESRANKMLTEVNYVNLVSKELPLDKRVKLAQILL